MTELKHAERRTPFMIGVNPIHMNYDRLNIANSPEENAVLFISTTLQHLKQLQWPFTLMKGGFIVGLSH